MNYRQKHCSTCQCYDSGERICGRCGMKQHIRYMNEFASGIFICNLQIQCEQRRSLIGKAA